MDLLIADLFLDVLIEQTCGETRVFRLLKYKAGRGLDRQFVEFLGRRAVIEAADRFGRDPQTIDRRQIDTAARDRPNDLIYIDRFERSVTFTDLHRGLGRVISLS